MQSRRRVQSWGDQQKGGVGRCGGKRLRALGLLSGVSDDAEL